MGLIEGFDVTAYYCNMLAKLLLGGLLSTNLHFLIAAMLLDLPAFPVLPQFTNVSTTAPGLGLNASRPIRCTRKPSWYNPPFNRDDCNSTLSYLYLEEMYSAAWRQRRFEFLDIDAEASTQLTRQITPRKYIFGMYY